MQTIIRTEPCLHNIFKDIDKCYQYLSEYQEQSPLVPVLFDSAFERLFALFEVFADSHYYVNYFHKNYEKFVLPKYDFKNIIVCFSGGKDSIATALHYKKCGYNVYLYYLKRINPTFFDEPDAVKKIAEVLDVPYYIDDSVHFKGHHDYVEHPMKNIIIASTALQWGIKNNIGTKIAFGNYISSSVYDDNFIFCGGDDIETWKAYEKIIRRIIPKFRIYLWLQNLGQTLRMVCRQKELLDMSVSCLCRTSLREYRHNWVKQKFGVELPKNRCGSCYKCCVEYIYMADHNLIEYQRSYYNYCLLQLFKNLQKEGEETNQLDYLWNHYFFYPIEKSKLFKEGEMKWIWNITKVCK